MDLTESQKVLVIPDADLTSDLMVTDSEDDHEEETVHIVADILTELVNTPQKKSHKNQEPPKSNEQVKDDVQCVWCRECRDGGEISPLNP